MSLSSRSVRAVSERNCGKVSETPALLQRRSRGKMKGKPITFIACSVSIDPVVVLLLLIVAPTDLTEQHILTCGYF